MYTSWNGSSSFCVFIILIDSDRREDELRGTDSHCTGFTSATLPKYTHELSSGHCWISIPDRDWTAISFAQLNLILCFSNLKLFSKIKPHWILIVLAHTHKITIFRYRYIQDHHIQTYFVNTKIYCMINILTKSLEEFAYFCQNHCRMVNWTIPQMAKQLLFKYT